MSRLASHSSGSWIGDGTATRFITTPFLPSVMFVQYPGVYAVWRSDEMAYGEALNPALGEAVADTILDFTYPGVLIGSALNVFGQTYYYQVFRDGVGFEHGSYVGDGTGLQRSVETDQVPEFIYVGKSSALGGGMQVWTTASGDFVVDAPRVAITGAGGSPAYEGHEFSYTIGGGTTTIHNYRRWQLNPGIYNGIVVYTGPFSTLSIPNSLFISTASGPVLLVQGLDWGIYYDPSLAIGGAILVWVDTSRWSLGAFISLDVNYLLSPITAIGSGPFTVKDETTGATIDPSNYTVTLDTGLIGGELVSDIGTSTLSWIGPTPTPDAVRVYGLPTTLEVTPYYERPVYWTPSLSGAQASRFMLGDLTFADVPFAADFAQEAAGLGVDAVVPGGFIVSAAQNSLNVTYHWFALKPQTAFASRITYVGASGTRTWNVLTQFVAANQSVVVTTIEGTFLSENVDYMKLSDVPIVDQMTLTNRGLWTTAGDLVSSYADVTAVTTTDLVTTYVEGTHYTKVVTAGVTTLHKIGTMAASVLVHGTLGRSPLYLQVNVALGLTVTQDVHGFPFAPDAVWVAPGQRAY